MPVFKRTCSAVVAAIALAAVWALGFHAMTSVTQTAYQVAELP